MSKKIIVSGLLNIETTLQVRGFPINYYPIDYPFFGINSDVSGVGCNIAKALTALGDEVRLVSFLGKDEEGNRIIRNLENSGISTSGISLNLKNSPVSVVLFDPDGKRQVYCDLKDIQEQSLSPASMKEKLQDMDIAVLCNINFNREIIKSARSYGIPIATYVHVLSDINDEYNKDFMENSDILFLSDERLPGEPEGFAEKLYGRYNNKIIVIGMGAKGALLYEGEKDNITIIPAYTPEKIVNTVGAGDALFSSFLHFYINGLSAVESLRRAVIFAGIKIGFNGAATGFTDETIIEKIINKS